MAGNDDLRSAYRCQVVDGQLITLHEPRARTECATVDDAMQRLQCGAAVVVAGVDMGPLRTRLASFGIG